MEDIAYLTWNFNHSCRYVKRQKQSQETLCRTSSEVELALF